MAAMALREHGFAGRLTLLGREIHAPYERPPLSKEVLCATQEPAIGVIAHDLYRDRAIDWQAGAEAVALDAARHEIALSDGRTLAYDRCLLATGGSARELTGLPRDTPGVHYVRTLDDARRLRAALTPGIRVAVIGGGFLGLELASSARKLQADVDVLEAAPRLLDRFLPPAGSAWLAARVRDTGVRLHLGAGLKAVRREAGSAHALQLEPDTGLPVAADVVVVAIGLTPETTLARQAGLAIDPTNGGIRIEADCSTSEVDVFAAGDCASQHRAIVAMHARFESWQNANEQGRCAAAGMLGLPPPPAAYPWFWTDQFDCNIQMLGLQAPDLAYVLRGDPHAQAAKAIWLGHRQGVPVHAIAVNAGGDLRQLRTLFEGGVAIDPAAFGDPSIALRSQVKAALQAENL